MIYKIRLFSVVILSLFALLAGHSEVHVKSPGELLSLFERLANSDLGVRNKASRELADFSKWWVQQDVEVMREYLPFALRGLDHTDPGVRIQASAFFAIVGMLRPHAADRIFEGVIPEVLRHFADPHERVRRNMVGSIAMMQPAPPQEAVEPLMNLIRKAPSRVPGELWLAGVAAAGLSRAAPDSPEVAEAISALIEEIPSAEGRRVVIQRLREARPQHPLIIEKLIVQLDEDDRLLRWDAAMALGAIGPAAGDAVAKLRSIAENPDTDDDLRIIVEGALRAIENNSPNRPE